MSLLRSKDALQDYADHPDKDLDKDEEKKKTQLAVLADINRHQHQFWNDIEDLKVIFQPFHEAQIQSEAEHSHLGLVIKR